MNHVVKRYAALAVLAVLVGGVALPVVPSLAGEMSSTGAVTADVKSTLLTKLRAARPDLEYEAVEATPVDGMYQVQVTGGPILYVSREGDYFFAGDLYRVEKTGFVNLREQAMTGERRRLLEQVALDDMIVFAAEGQPRAVINVFTDIDCGYCRKLHREVPELNRLGIEVRYLAFPRAGVGSPGYVKAVKAWCSSAPGDTLTQLKNGDTVDAAVCAENPVAAQYQLGQKMGIDGTPALVLSDGTLLPGYRPAKDLARTLGLQN